MPADKTSNFYETKPETYRELLMKNISDRYRKVQDKTVSDMNTEAKKQCNLSQKTKEIIPNNPAFKTLKDHKRHQPKGVINLTKTKRTNQCKHTTTHQQRHQKSNTTKTVDCGAIPTKHSQSHGSVTCKTYKIRSPSNVVDFYPPSQKQYWKEH